MRGRYPLLVAGLLLASVASGCISNELGDGDPGDDTNREPTAPDALNTYITLASEPLADITLETSRVEQYRIATTGGVELDTWIVRPDIDGPVPVVLEVTPYYGGGRPIFQTGVQQVDSGLTSGVGTLARILVEHGYAFGISSVRGTGNSGGCFTQGGPQEGKDTATVVEEIAAQPWANGNVGIIGVSYPGTTPQQVWLEAPPALKTIVPISGISDFYKYNFANGVPIWIQGYGFNTYYWPVTGITPAGLSGGYGFTDPVHLPGKIAGEACTDQAEVQSAGVQATLDGNKGEYWQERDFPAIHRDTWDRNDERASVFYIHGLQDWNVKPHNMEEWLEQIQDSGVPYKVWLGQWGHAWPSWREDWWNVTVLAWFDEFLKQTPTGILDAPAVQVQDDSLRWRHEERWPPRDTRLLVYYLHADGSLRAEPGAGEVTYHDRAGGRLSGVPNADALWGPDQVTFETEPLAQEIVLAGQPRLVLNATATGSRASLMVSLHESGASERSFNFGVQSLNHAEDLAQGQADIAGKRVPVDLLLFPQDSRLLEGSTIRLIAAPNVIGSPAPDFQPISDGSDITLHLEGARLELPVDDTLVFEDPQPCWREVDEGESRCGEIP